MKVKVVLFEEKVVGVYKVNSVAEMASDVSEIFRDYIKHRPYKTPEQKKFVREKFREDLRFEKTFLK